MIFCSRAGDQEETQPYDAESAEPTSGKGGDETWLQPNSHSTCQSASSFHSCIVSGWGFPPKVLTRTQQLALKAKRKEANKTKKGKGKGNKTSSQDMSKPKKGVRKPRKQRQATSAASTSNPANSEGSKVKPVEPNSVLKRSKSTKRMRVMNTMKVKKGNVTKSKKGSFQEKGTAAKHTRTNKGNAGTKKNKEEQEQDKETPSTKAGQRKCICVIHRIYLNFSSSMINGSMSAKVFKFKATVPSNMLQASTRFQHTSLTLELKQIISDFNAQCEGSCRMMMYWSRGAIAFSINNEGKSQQVGVSHILQHLPHPTIEFRASAVSWRRATVDVSRKTARKMLSCFSSARHFQERFKN